jgi:hypothetical protein
VVSTYYFILTNIFLTLQPADWPLCETSWLATSFNWKLPRPSSLRQTAKAITIWWMTFELFKSLMMMICLTLISAGSFFESRHCPTLLTLLESLYQQRYLRVRDFQTAFLLTGGPNNRWWLLDNGISERRHWRPITHLAVTCSRLR